MSRSRQRLRRVPTLLALSVISVLLSACNLRGALESAHDPGALPRAAGFEVPSAADLELVAEQGAGPEDSPAEPERASEPSADSEPSGEQPSEQPARESGDEPAADGQPEQAASEPADDQGSEPGEGGSEPAAASEASSQGLSAIEQQIFDLLSRARAEAGVPALQLDPELAASARSFSCEMASGAAPFAHDADKIRAAGANGENIAFGTFSEAEAAQRAHELWMDSPDHRENRMSPGFTTYGVGACSEGHRIYFTERFAF